MKTHLGLHDLRASVLDAGHERLGLVVGEDQSRLSLAEQRQDGCACKEQRGRGEHCQVGCVTQRQPCHGSSNLKGPVLPKQQPCRGSSTSTCLLHGDLCCHFYCPPTEVLPQRALACVCCGHGASSCLAAQLLPFAQLVAHTTWPGRPCRDAVRTLCEPASRSAGPTGMAATTSSCPPAWRLIFRSLLWTLPNPGPLGAPACVPADDWNVL